jgi:hypothetical protein
LIRAIDAWVHLLIRREAGRRACELQLILGARLFDLTNTSGRILVFIHRIYINIGAVFGHIAFFRFTGYCRLLEILGDTEIFLQAVFVILHSVTAAFTQIHFQSLVAVELFRINTVFACTYFIKLMSFIDRDKFLYFL